ncbi:hypothetical protein B7494_g3287 [Chlorociboria aeruginascens]|nr:hypothetical protein B7494_g3287 [Chlorociboria aeruginascens]
MSSNNDITPPNEFSGRPRRSSITAQTFNSLFGRSASTTAPIPTSAGPDRRRMSISTVGLSGTSPTQPAFPFGVRRSSVSTADSNSIDENAIDDDDGPARSTPTTPYTRRMSFGAQALRSVRTGGSPGASGRSSSYPTNSSLAPIPSGRRGGTTPPKSQANQASMQSTPRTASDLPSARPGEGGGFNWSEQLRSRAESSVSQTQRPNFSIPSNKQIPLHERSKSVNEMPSPPPAISPPPPARPARKQPDAFQERILKGDFYMD